MVEHKRTCDNQTPRERIDNALLLDLLSEAEPSGRSYGSSNRERRVGECGCRRERTACRGSNQNTNPTPYSPVREDRQDGRCEDRCESRRETRCESALDNRRENRCENALDNRREDRCEGRIDARSERDENSCQLGCAVKNCLSNFSLAMAYVPDQEWHELYEEEEALERGTIFRELDLPFYPTPCYSGCRRTNPQR